MIFIYRFWVTTKIIRLELLEKLWLNRTLHEPNKKKKWEPLVLNRGDLWMMWRCHAIPCFHFYFLFRNNGKRNKLDGNDFRLCYMVIFFESVIPKVLDYSYVQQLQGNLTTAFERHLSIENFTDMDQHRCWACNKTFDLIVYASLSLKQS